MWRQTVVDVGNHRRLLLHVPLAKGENDLALSEKRSDREVRAMRCNSLLYAVRYGFQRVDVVSQNSCFADNCSWLEMRFEMN